VQSNDQRDALLEWKCILDAKGYGNNGRTGSFQISFEVVPTLSMWLPDHDTLDLVAQVT
jgi:hypothetical protein